MVVSRRGVDTGTQEHSSRRNPRRLVAQCAHPLSPPASQIWEGIEGRTELVAGVFEGGV